MRTSLLVALALLGYASAALQNITVKGVTICSKKRMPNVQVELWEKDTFDPDDKMMAVESDAQGEFQVFGKEDEVTSINPYLIIKHKCNTKKPGCTRISRYEIPKAKINSLYDMTYVPLDIIQADDQEKC